jgi:hypothetical protein
MVDELAGAVAAAALPGNSPWPAVSAMHQASASLEEGVGKGLDTSGNTLHRHTQI